MIKITPPDEEVKQVIYTFDFSEILKGLFPVSTHNDFNRIYALLSRALYDDEVRKKFLAPGIDLIFNQLESVISPLIAFMTQIMSFDSAGMIKQTEIEIPSKE